MIGSLDVLRSEIERLKQELSHCVFPVVLCHNDLTNRNIIHNEENGMRATAVQSISVAFECCVFRDFLQNLFCTQEGCTEVCR